MSLREYYPIDEPEFDTIMNEYGFLETKIQGVNEKVYDYEINGIIVRVYSSLEYGTARKCGKDAIRVCCIDPRTNQGLIRNKRVHRIVSWKKNLVDRLDSTFQQIKERKIHLAPNCPNCDAPMILGKAKKGPNAGNEFWGCSNFFSYPRCHGSRNT